VYSVDSHHSSLQVSLESLGVHVDVTDSHEHVAQIYFAAVCSMFPYDAILVDFDGDVNTAGSVVRTVRTKELAQSLFPVVMIGSISSWPEEEFDDLDVDELLVKPVQPEQLAVLLRHQVMLHS